MNWHVFGMMLGAGLGLLAAFFTAMYLLDWVEDKFGSRVACIVALALVVLYAAIVGGLLA